MKPSHTLNRPTGPARASAFCDRRAVLRLPAAHTCCFEGWMQQCPYTCLLWCRRTTLLSCVPELSAVSTLCGGEAFANRCLCMTTCKRRSLTATFAMHPSSPVLVCAWPRLHGACMCSESIAHTLQGCFACAPSLMPRAWLDALCVCLLCAPSHPGAHTLHGAWQGFVWGLAFGDARGFDLMAGGGLYWRF